MKIICHNDNYELIGRIFEVLEEFENSYNVCVDGVSTRVSKNDVEIIDD